MVLLVHRGRIGPKGEAGRVVGVIYRCVKHDCCSRKSERKREKRAQVVSHCC